MTDKEFRKLSRGDLIEIIYQLQLRETELMEKLDQAERQLADRRIRIDTAGSIAEAALNLSGIFEAADRAVSQYVAEAKQSILENARRDAVRSKTDSAAALSEAEFSSEPSVQATPERDGWSAEQKTTQESKR